jgi:lipoprotein-releasing system permease protein
LGLGFSYNIEAIRQILEKMSGIELFQAEIYFLSKLPSRVDLHEVSAVVLMALGFSFIATIYPAWRASRLNPVEGLRYE